MKRIFAFLLTMIALMGICTLTAGASEEGTASVKVVSKAGEVFFEAEGVTFTKLYDGEAYVGLWENGFGVIVPFLAGETPESVAFTLSDGTTVNAVENQGITYQKRIYCYSDVKRLQPYAKTAVDPTQHDLFLTTGSRPGYDSIVDRWMYGRGYVCELLHHNAAIEAGGEFPLFWKNNWLWASAVVLAALAVVIYLVREFIEDRKKDKAFRERAKNITEYSPLPPERTAQEIRDMENMEIVKQINQNINPTGEPW